VSYEHVYQFASGSKDHIKVQGEILEGLVARIVGHDSSKHMEKVLRDFPPPPLDGCKPLKSLFLFLDRNLGSIFFFPELENVQNQNLHSEHGPVPLPY